MTLTLDELKAWAENDRPFDDQVWVGDDISIADVKATVRTIFEAQTVAGRLRDFAAMGLIKPDPDDIAAWRDALEKLAAMKTQGR